MAATDKMHASASQGCVSARERLVAASQPGALSLEKLGYTWEQTEHEVRIIFPVAADEVSCKFSSRSCILTACSGQQLQHYVFEIQRTFAPIDPDQSVARVPRSKRCVTLKMRKQTPGLDWPCLRCDAASMRLMSDSV